MFHGVVVNPVPTLRVGFFDCRVFLHISARASFSSPLIPPSSFPLDFVNLFIVRFGWNMGQHLWPLHFFFKIYHHLPEIIPLLHNLIPVFKFFAIIQFRLNLRRELIFGWHLWHLPCLQNASQFAQSRFFFYPVIWHWMYDRTCVVRFIHAKV